MAFRWIAQDSQPFYKFKTAAISAIVTDPDFVLKSGGGNWNDDNLQTGDEENVRDLVPFGLGQAGTLLEKDLTFAEEEERNTALASKYQALIPFKQLGEDLVGQKVPEVHAASEVLNTAAFLPGNVHLPTTAQVEDGVMFGPASALEGTFEGGTPLALPAKITGAAAAPLSSTSMRVTWALAPSTGGPAAFYRVYRGAVLVGTVTDALEYEDGLATPLSPSTAYSYTVSGVNDTGEGPQSDAATGTTPATASPVPADIAVPLSFYSVRTAGDEATVDTLLYSGVYGTLDVQRNTAADSAAFGEFIKGYLFIPDKHLTGIGKGVKVIDANANILTVEICEDIEGDHQEIVLRKVNA